jgi:hypothetical protein
MQPGHPQATTWDTEAAGEASVEHKFPKVIRHKNSRHPTDTTPNHQAPEAIHCETIGTPARVVGH